MHSRGFLIFCLLAAILSGWLIVRWQGGRKGAAAPALVADTKGTAPGRSQASNPASPTGTGPGKGGGGLPSSDSGNFDRRQPEKAVTDHDQALAHAREERQQAAKRLQSMVRGASVDFDETLGSPKFLSSTRAFLTGANGEGGAVPASRMQEFAADDPHRVVKGFLAEHAALYGYGPAALDGARVIRDYETANNGLHTTVWQQELDGVRVFESTFQANVTRKGELVNISSRFVPDARQAAETGTPNGVALLASPVIDARQAVSAAAQTLGETVPAAQIVESGQAEGPTRKQQFQNAQLLDVGVEFVWLPQDESAMRLCWEVIFTSKQRGEMFRTLVDAETGEALVRQGLTEYISPASYRVFTGDSPTPMSPGLATPGTAQPAQAARTLVTLDALDTTASPNGWIDDGVIETRGNNADAHLDLNADNVPDTPRPQGGVSRIFDFPLDLTQAPSGYRDAVVTDLFYWNNVIHDRYYQLGFTEAAGNFQTNVFGRGGLGNDPVQADAQDGSGTNNANFSTPPDGSPGRMQMYVFTYPTPDRDGDFDHEIVIHEYTHGLSNRLVGGGVGMSAMQSRGLGEGWSDFYPLCLLSEPGDDPNGVYASGAYASYQFGGLTQNYYFGIRRYPYCTSLTKNPLTFKDIDPAQASPHVGVPQSPIGGGTADEVHNVGEVWCATLWDARANLIAKHGAVAGNDLILQLVTDGMKLAPANPNFLQARDAIIQADMVDNAGANRGELWAAFAKRGMGSAATSPASGTTIGLVENYDFPDDLGISPPGLSTAGGMVGGPFTPGVRAYTLTNSGVAPLSWTAANTQAWLTLAPAGGTLAPGAAVAVTATLNANANALLVGTYADTITFTNATSGIPQLRDMQLRVEPLTQPIFNETWEGGTVGSAWAITGTSTHRTQVTTANLPHSGIYHLTMDSSADGTYARNEATLTVDLAGRQNVLLRFWVKMFNEDPNGPPTSPFQTGADFDGVAISADGTNWYEVQPLRTYVSEWTRYTVDLDAALAAHGLSYNANFKIRFNHYDNFTIPTDGFAFDDIELMEVVNNRLTLTLPTTANEGDGSVNATLTVFPVPPSPLTVTLATSDATEAGVPATITVPAGQASVVIPVTLLDDVLLDGTQNVTLTATAAGFSAATANLGVEDNETATLLVSLPAATDEGGPDLQGTVTMSGPAGSDVTVALSSGAPADLQVPASVVIPAGQASALFPITTVDDNRIDGTVTVTLTAHVANWTDGTAAISVADNESASLVVSLPGPVSEGDGPRVGSLQISGTLTTPLTVTLASDDTTELTVPATVTIPARQTSANFLATIVDDPDPDGVQTSHITASAPGFSDGSAAVSVADNEPHHFTFNTISGPQVSGTGFAVTIVARDVNGAVASGFRDTADLTATTGGGNLPLTPGTTSAFSGGQWTGNVAVTQVADNVVLHATNGAATGDSNPFNLLVPPVQALSLATNDLIYDAGSQRIYASTPTGSLLAIDPTVGAIGAPTVIGTTAGKLARSDDGHFLYVAIDNGIRRFDLLTQSPGLQWSLGATSGTNLQVGDIEVLPGNPESVAVAKKAGTHSDYVAIYDNGVQRALQTIYPKWSSVIEFGDSADALYGYYNESTGYYFNTMAVDALGVTVTNTTSNLISGFSTDMKYAGGRVFASSGRVIDPVARALVATLNASGLVCPDVASDRVFFLTGSGSTWTLRAFSTSNFLEIGSLAITGISGTPTSLIRWGGNGLAFRTSSNQVYLIRDSALVPSVASADLGLTQIGSPDPATVGSNLTYTLQVANNGLASAENVVVTDTLPAGVTFLSATSSQGTCSQAGGVVTANLGPLVNRATATITIRGQPSAVGTLTNSASVTASLPDPNANNNLSVRTTTVAAATGGTRITQIPLAASDLIYDKITGRLFASVPGSVPGFGNNVVPIDPATGAVGSPIFIGSNPIRLAISDDAQRLFAGLDGAAGVRWIDLGTEKAGPGFTLGNSSSTGPLFAEDLEVLPGSIDAVAISLRNIGFSPRHEGVAVFDNGIPRVVRTPGHTGSNVIEFAGAADTLFGYNNETTEYGFRTMNVSPSGVTIANSTQSLVDGFYADIEADGGRIYSTTGRVVDPFTCTLLGTISANGPVRPDASINRVFFLSGSGSALTVLSYDATTFAQVGSVPVPGAVGTAGSLVRWGDSGLAFRTSSGQVFIVESASVVPPPAVKLTLPASASEGDGVLPGAGRIALAAPTVADAVFQLSSDQASDLSVPATVTVPVGQKGATFDLTIGNDSQLNGVRKVTVSVAGTGYPTVRSAMEIRDNEAAAIALTLPASGTEGTTVQGTVTLSSAPAVDVSISLVSNTPTLATVPAKVVIPANQLSANFPVQLVDDNVINGARPVRISASLGNWTPASRDLDVLDNENRTLIVNLPGQFVEDAGTLIGVGTVSLSGAFPTHLTVSLDSSDTSAIQVPASVIIPAGQTSASFHVKVVNDSATNGSKTSTVTASAAGFTSGASPVVVINDDPHHFSFTTIPSPQAGGQPIAMTITAKDASEVTVSVFRGNASLSATTDGGQASVSPSNVSFVAGVWTGQVALANAATNARLVCTAGAASGASNPFDVLAAPDIDLAPASITLTVNSGDIVTRTLDIRNTGGSPLIWSLTAETTTALGSVIDQSAAFHLDAPAAVDENKESAGQPGMRPDPSDLQVVARASHSITNPAVGLPLQTVLANLNQKFASINGIIPARYNFSEGGSGTNISDGGNDMYDGGNCLGTNLGSLIPYSDNVIATSAALGGAGYFTRKYDGLFVFAADLAGAVNYFEITGNLGADGSGTADAAVLNVSRGGVNYRGFVKRVFSAGDPSVNHLIIVADNGSVSHEFASYTNDDYHRVTSLGGITRVYHLLYAGASGAYIDNAATLKIMQEFLAAIGTPDWFAPSQTSGTLAAGQTQTITLTFNTSRLPTGTYSASLSIASNDPDETVVNLPITMDVLGAPAILVSPAALDFGGQAVPATRDVTITSNGSDPLTVGNVTVAGPQFSIPVPVPFTLAPGETRAVPVTFTPLGLSVSTGSLSIVSDSTSQPSLDVPLSGSGSVHHFAWNPISNQSVNTPFSATVTAKDASDATIANFTGTAQFVASMPVTPQVGTGTNTNSHPFYGSSQDVRAQIIYLAGELGRPGRMTGLALYVGSVGSGTFNSWTIRLKHTSLSSYASASWEGSGWTEVYRANFTSNASGWVTFPFTTPFDYDGTSNLLVDFSFDNAATTGTSYCRTTYQSSPARAIFGTSNSTAGDPRTWSGTGGAYPYTESYIPHIQFTMDALLPITPATSGAFVDGVWTGQFSVPFATTAVRLNAEDGQGHSGLSNPFAVQGASLPGAALPFTETFEGGTLSPSWTISGTNNYRTQVTSANSPHGGTRHLTMDDSAYTYSRNEATLSLDLLGYSGVTLTFWAKEFNDSPNGPPPAPFTGGADFDGLAISADGVNWYEVQPLRTLTNSWTQLSVNLDAALAARGLSYTTNFKLRFNQYGYGSIPNGGIAIDDISIVGSPVGRLITTLPVQVAEGAGTLSGSVSLPGVRGTTTVVTLASSAPSKVTVPSSVTIPAGALSANFPFTVLEDGVFDGGTTVDISSTTAGLATGSAMIQILDNDLPSLILSAPATTKEGSAALTGTLTLGAVPSGSVAFSLVSSRTTDLQVPPSVAFQPGQTTVAFPITVLNDAEIDGTQNVTLTASAPGWKMVTASVSVADNENSNLTLSAPYSVAEGQSSTGYVYLSGTLPAPLVVTLGNSNSAELTVPTTITIPAGLTSVSFTASGVDDTIQDGTQSAIVIASAAGFTAATSNVSVLDNDVHHFAFTSTIGASQIANKTFSTGLEARDINNVRISTYKGTLNLTASGSGGTVPVAPVTVTMSSGWWSGNLAITTPATGVTITASAGGLTGVSNIFNVGFGAPDHLAWTAIGSPQTVGMPFDATVTAKDAYENTLPTVNGAASLSAGLPSHVTGTTIGNYGFLFSSSSQQRDQAIYLPAEVGPAGRITRLALQANFYSDNVTGTLPNFTVRMKHTALAGYGTSPAWESTGWTTVYQGNLPVSGSGIVWVDVPLTTPFTYDGTSNLMVDFTHNGNTSVSSACVATSRSNTRTLYYSGSGYSDPLTWSGTSSPTPGVSMGLPNLRLGFEGTVPLTPASITLTNGVWSGQVTVNHVAANIALAARLATGTAGESNTFSVTGTPTLEVTPVGGLTATGNFGGPFTPANATYTLTNTGNAPLIWTASKTATWLNLSSTGGTLAVGASTTVSATIDATTTELGSYTDTLTFTNLSSGLGNTTRAISLTVLLPTFLPAPTLAPEPPVTGGTSNTVSWSAVHGADSYEVQAAPDPAFNSPFTSGWLTNPSHTFTGLGDGQLYNYRVRARRAFAGTTGVWTQTSQADFATGITTGVSTGTSPGSVVLASGDGAFTENFDEPGTAWADTIFPNHSSASPTRSAQSVGPNASPSLPVNQGGDFEGSIGNACDALMADVPQNRIADATIEAYLTPSNRGTLDHSGLVLRASGATQLNGYDAIVLFYSDGTAKADFSRRINGIGTWFYTATSLFTFGTNENLRMRFSASGSTLSLTLWRVSVLGGVVTEVPIPFFNGTNTLTATDTMYSSGLAGLHHWSSFGTSSMLVDDVSVTVPGSGYLASGTISSPAITPVPWQRWGAVTFARDTSGAGTALTVDVLDAGGTLLAANLSSGTDLNAIPAIAGQSSIRLRANLSTTNSANTPRLDDWSVSWQATPGTSVESIWSPAVFSRQDATKPVIMVTTPQVTTAPALSLTGLATDFFGIANLTVNGAPALSTDHFLHWNTASVVLTPGWNTFDLFAADNAAPANTLSLSHFLYFATSGGDADFDGMPDSWESRHELDLFDATGESGANGDFDKDGLGNLIEYAFGLDPRVADVAGAPSVTVEINPADGQRYLVLRYRRLLSPGRLIYTIEVANDLVTWSSDPAGLEEIGMPLPTGDGTTETVSTRIKPSINTATQPSRFVRVRVAVP